jgi:hypothetical protein
LTILDAEQPFGDTLDLRDLRISLVLMSYASYVGHLRSDPARLRLMTKRLQASSARLIIDQVPGAQVKEVVSNPAVDFISIYRD